jgi:hypothetical protein
MPKRPRQEEADADRQPPASVAPLRVTRSFLLQAALRQLQAPRVVLHLVAACLTSPTLRALHGPQLDFIEVFAGQAEISRALRASGLSGASFDIAYDPDMQDLASPRGFLHCLLLCLQARPGALAVLAVARL